MESILGFLMINVYAFLIILSTTILFFSKSRLRQLEDETYKRFLLSSLFMSFSGLVLGLAVSPSFLQSEFVIVILNKVYLLTLLFWIGYLTYYYYSLLLNDNTKEKKKRKIFEIIGFFCVLFIVCLPLNVDITEASAVAGGPAILFTYAIFLIGFVFQIVCVIKRRNLKNTKNIPLYLLILLGTLVVIVMMINPSLNYIINPIFIFIAFVMYHTIENPDVKMIDEMHKAKEITDNSNEEKEIFLYNMTNDIRQITKDIDMETNAILNELSNKKINTGVIDTAAREIKNSTARFTTMTNEVLDISQIDSNIKVYNDKYNAKLVIKELVQIYKNKCSKKGLKFTTTFASDIPEYLYGDGVELKKTLSIVLDNSVKHTENGFIDFDINVITKRDVARLIITIEDSGTGMKAEELNKIFNKKEEKRDEKYDLDDNLYNAKRLVVLMGGTIIANSVYGKGTTIKIILDQKIGETVDTLTKYENLYDKKRILLVDDSDTSCKIIAKMLKDTNVILEVVNLGKDALDKIRSKEKYDLILIDEEMSPLSGIDVMSKLKEIKTFNMNTILLTKNNEYEYNDEYLKYGFSDYLLKPIEKDKLFEKIDKYLK